MMAILLAYDYENATLKLEQETDDIDY